MSGDKKLDILSDQYKPVDWRDAHGPLENLIADNAPFQVGMDLLPLFENRKFKKSDFVVGRRFYVWNSGHARVELVTRMWQGWYYIERVPLDGALRDDSGRLQTRHVYGTPLLERALVAAEFCTQGWEPEYWDDGIGSRFPEFPDEVRGTHNGYYGGDE